MVGLGDFWTINSITLKEAKWCCLWSWRTGNGGQAKLEGSERTPSLEGKPYFSLRSTPHPGCQSPPGWHALFLASGTPTQTFICDDCIPGSEPLLKKWWFLFDDDKPLLLKKRWFAPTKIWKHGGQGLLRVNQWLGCRRCDLKRWNAVAMTSCKWSWRATSWRCPKMFLLSNEQKPWLFRVYRGWKTLPSYVG